MSKLLSVLFVVVLVGAACGSDTTSAESADSPLAEFLGDDVLAFDLDDQEAAQQQFIEQERARQEIIATCMQDLGFEYIPRDPEQFTFFDEEGDGPEWGTTEWTEKYGFGISTQWFSQQQVGPDLVGYDDSFVGEDIEDPNQEIVSAMSESESEAYYEALYGGDDAFPQIDETLSEEEIDAQFEDFEWQPQGCEGEAYASEDSPERFYIEFSDELDEMWERIESDPRIAEAEAEVSACVSEKGFTFTAMDDVYQTFESRLQELDGAQDMFPEVSEAEIEEMTEAELEELFNQGPPPLSDADLSVLAEIQADEIATAVAVEECGGGWEAQSELFDEVRIEYEQEFVDANADRLSEFKDGE
ncbi:MAG: hypothetical protein AAF962_21785 [Actinomycetota bacterium]